ncbi:unnamed protein product [Didymodactylos carnosus]|uniref:Uncharacterized protein n=1 Tax=Didymodactylos carnosus TaxID=1234261 RepID=A0A815WJJ2_9BILA|nr:unnamed protein product [Didymodactylos carnosus]CAF1544290.1 unnamed protein product [Didymodactylos carnosus]CAF3702304.1 unnamed protein product [Didymodactylos carnosus]CAF4404848.1 unnamed protein product [Didymodactylos carnosus]
MSSDLSSSSITFSQTNSNTGSSGARTVLRSNSMPPVSPKRLGISNEGENKNLHRSKSRIPQSRRKRSLPHRGKKTNFNQTDDGDGMDQGDNNKENNNEFDQAQQQGFDSDNQLNTSAASDETIADQNSKSNTKSDPLQKRAVEYFTYKPHSGHYTCTLCNETSEIF